MPEKCTGSSSVVTFGVFLFLKLRHSWTDITTRPVFNGERPTILQKHIILHLLEVFAHLESFFAVAHRDIGSDKSVGVSGGWLQVCWQSIVLFRVSDSMLIWSMLQDVIQVSIEFENHLWITHNSEQCNSSYASSVDSALHTSNQIIFIILFLVYNHHSHPTAQYLSPCCHAQKSYLQSMIWTSAKVVPPGV